MMQMTFIVAQKFGTTPFDVMSRDLDWVIMVVNHFLERDSAKQENSALSEKERDKDFWSAL